MLSYAISCLTYRSILVGQLLDEKCFMQDPFVCDLHDWERADLLALNLVSGVFFSHMVSLVRCGI